MFGSSYYKLLKIHFSVMIDAASVTKFDKTLDSARDLLHSRPNRSGDMETNLAKFDSQQQHYATYCLWKFLGNSWCVWFWSLIPDRVPLPLGEMGGGATTGFRRSERTSVEPLVAFKRDAKIASIYS